MLKDSIHCNPSRAMLVRLNLASVTLALGVQLVAFWAASGVISSVNSYTKSFDAEAAIEQAVQHYHPLHRIGSPSNTVGAGTR